MTSLSLTDTNTHKHAEAWTAMQKKKIGRKCNLDVRNIKSTSKHVKLSLYMQGYEHNNNTIFERTSKVSLKISFGHKSVSL